MSWFKQTDRSFLQRCAIRILRTGTIPRHLAFIMDGNRRFASKHKLTTVITGHEHGFDKLTEILGWCNDLGIEEVTVYAFSIENFKRTGDEVNGLLSLAKEKFAKLLSEREKLMEQGVCIRVFGETSMLPVDLQQLLAQTVIATRSNSRAFLNVCFAYTSRAEVTAAVNHILTAADDGRIKDTDVTSCLLQQCLWSSESTEPDLVIRTSGESRLSDFILWQSGYSVIAFVHKLWPEFTIWDLLKSVFYFQRHETPVSQARLNYSQRRRTEMTARGDWTAVVTRQEALVRHVREQRVAHLNALVKEVAVQCG